MACGIFPNQGLNLCPLHCKADSLPLDHQRSPANHLYECHLEEDEQQITPSMLACVLGYLPVGSSSLFYRCYQMASAAFLLGRGREDQEESPFLQIDKLLYRELERLQELYGKLLERGD